MGKKAKSSKPGPKKKWKLPLGKKIRCTLQGFGTAIDELKLRPEHINELQKTPFWHLYEAFISNRVPYRRKYDSATLQMIEQYNPENKTFTLGTREMRITSEDVSLIFGIINGTKAIDLTYSQRVYSGFITRRFPDDPQINVSKISAIIHEAASGRTEDDIKDTVRLLCLLVCTKVLFATGGDRVRWGFILYIEEIESMRDYNWCEAILNELQTSISKANIEASNVTGCTTLLQIWLCEHLKCFADENKNDKSQIHLKPDYSNIPRFIKWDLIKLHRHLRIRELAQLQDNEVLPMDISETLSETVIYQPYIERLQDPSNTVPPYRNFTPEMSETAVRVDEMSTNSESDGYLNNNVAADSEDTLSGKGNACREGESGGIEGKETSHTPWWKSTSGNREKEIHDVSSTYVNIDSSTTKNLMCEIINVESQTKEKTNPDDTTTTTQKMEPSTQEILDDMWKKHLFCSPEKVTSIDQQRTDTVMDNLAKCLSFDEEKLMTPKTVNTTGIGILDDSSPSDGTGRSFFEERQTEDNNPRTIIKKLVRDTSFFSDVATSLEKEVIKLKEELKQKKEDSVNAYELKLTLKEQEINNLKNELQNQQSMVIELQNTIHDMKQKFGKQSTSEAVCQKFLETPSTRVHKEVKLRGSHKRTSSFVRKLRMRKRKAAHKSPYIYPDWRRKKKAKTDQKVVDAQQTTEQKEPTTKSGKISDPIDVDDIDFDKFKDFKVLKSLWEKSNVYKHLQEEDKLLLNEILNADSTLCTTVYTRDDEIDSVTLADICSVLLLKEISSNVINCFADYLMEMQLTRYSDKVSNQNNNKSFIFHSLCLPWVEDGDQEALNEFINPHIENDCGEYRYKIFPLLHRSDSRYGQHWTLGVLDTLESKWSYFNSMRPRTSGSKDKYLPGMIKMSNYITNHANSKELRQPQGKVESKAEKKDVLIQNIINSPQQEPGTVDCGVIVCDIMANITLRNKQNPTSKSTATRAGLVHALLNTPGRSWTKESYTAHEEARLFQLLED